MNLVMRSGLIERCTCDNVRVGDLFKEVIVLLLNKLHRLIYL